MRMTDQAADSLSEAKKAAEKRLIEQTLAATGGHLGRTAKALGISRTTLWAKIRRYRIVQVSEQLP
jgi:transcriptional regulator with PAS, ATPase and Fis domain